VVRNGSKWGALCPQLSEGGTGKFLGDEDCLFLNVYVPTACLPNAKSNVKTSSCAVMTWLHGGGYCVGGVVPSERYPASTPFDGSSFNRLAKDAIVVTVGYRLGVLGFAGAEDLGARDKALGGEGSTGNYGLQDQRMALTWVQDNIVAFGGDKHNVLLFGESAGGGGVSAHLTAPRSFGLYHRAIVESGLGFWTATTMVQAQAQFEDLKNITGCGKMSSAMKGESSATTAGPLDCLLNFGATNLTQLAMSEWGDWPKTHAYGTMRPTVDHVELMGFPWAEMDAGRLNTNVSVMVGYNKDEGTNAIASSVESFGGFHMNETSFRAWLTDPSAFAWTRPHPVPFTRVDEAVEVYRANQGSDMDYKNWYWSATHVNGDYGESCPANRAVRALARFSNENVFQYYFSHGGESAVPDGAGLPGVNDSGGCSHGYDITYVWQTSPGNCVGSPAGNYPCPESDGERLLAETMASYWVNFAKTGDPNPAAGGLYYTSLMGNITDENGSKINSWEPVHKRGEGVGGGTFPSIEFSMGALSVAQGRNERQCAFIDSLGAPPGALLPA
jgi:para-nitrobenzyl esterase